MAAVVGFGAKLDEIRSCKRIVSANFHGLIVAEAFGIPCLAFPGAFSGPIAWRVREDHAHIDHRMADFYSGAGADRLGAFGQPCDRPTRWADVIDAVDRLWTPLPPRGLDDFLGSFPIDRVVGTAATHWPVEAAVLDGVPF